ncbi:UBX domain-containing protein 4 [Linderina pennispora]|nr:UBX domain-containing protein 4 [Linderina pennispora]
MEEYRKRLAKEKRADAAYRKTILESIKQDREDFKAVHGTPTSASGSKDTAWRKQLADTTGKTKILFRISDGRVESGEFDVQAEFAEVRAFVEGIEGIPKGSLDIAEAFPRRMLGGDVDDKSLSDLGLVPTATLLVNVSARRVKDGEAFKEPVTWLAFFYSMLAAVFGFFGAFLPGRKSEDENQATYTREDGAVARSTARREEKSPDEKLTRRRNTSPGSEAGSDDDEKPKTYNGNSTNLE